MGPHDLSPGRHRVRRLVTAVVALASWGALGVVAVVLLTIGAGVGGPSTLIALQGMVPLLLLAVPGLGVVAGLLRRPPLAVASGVVTLALLAAAMGPASADGPPTWAEGAPRLVVFAANVRYDNPWPERVVARVAATDADVVVLNEVTPALLAELRRSGVLRRYPVRSLTSMDGGFGEMVMARRGAEVGVEALGPLNAPALTVHVGGRSVRVLALHPQAPASAWARARWYRQFEALRRRSAERTGALLLVGDFNAAAWHQPFRALLDTGLRDAHGDRGQGLSRSWGPMVGQDRVVPLLRIDHALASPELAAVRVDDGEVPGSDHRSQQVVYAVRPEPDRPGPARVSERRGG